MEHKYRAKQSMCMMWTLKQRACSNLQELNKTIWLCHCWKVHSPNKMSIIAQTLSLNW